MRRIVSRLGMAAVAAGLLSTTTHTFADKRIDCEMTFQLKGWSAVYKTAKGTGNVTCDNGQSFPVTIKVTGGGVTFGKTDIHNGKGKFSEVGDVNDLFGSYGAAEAEAGAAKASMAEVLTKGTVQLALSGTGDGWSIGVSGSKFTISKK